MNPREQQQLVQQELRSCAREQVQGRERLARIRRRLIDAGYPHIDTPALCRRLGFTVRGLQVEEHHGV